MPDFPPLVPMLGRGVQCTWHQASSLTTHGCEMGVPCLVREGWGATGATEHLLCFCALARSHMWPHLILTVTEPGLVTVPIGWLRKRSS